MVIFRQSYDSRKLTLIFSEKMANLASFNSILRIEGVKIVQNGCNSYERESFELSENLPEKSNIFILHGENRN